MEVKKAKREIESLLELVEYRDSSTAKGLIKSIYKILESLQKENYPVRDSKSIWIKIDAIERQFLNKNGHTFERHDYNTLKILVNDTFKDIEKNTVSKSEKWIHLIISIVVYSFVPIIAYVIRSMHVEELSIVDNFLAMSIYCLTMTIAMKHRILLMLSILCTSVVCMFSSTEPVGNAFEFSVIVTVTCFFLHVIDRAIIHIVKCEPFFKND